MKQGRLSKGKYNLVCVAHPDDETLFFGGLVMTNRRLPWKIICVTDANADGEGKRRRRQFSRACRALGVRDIEWLKFPDIYEKRLPIDALAKHLAQLPTPHSVFTHGIIGEYGHPHHQDVSYAVHQAFQAHPRIFVSAYNSFPDLRIDLDKKVFARKAEILALFYGSETRRFLNLLPVTSTEGFVQLTRRELEALYDFFARRKPLRKKDLKVYTWLVPFIKTRRKMPRPF